MLFSVNENISLMSFVPFARELPALNREYARTKQNQLSLCVKYTKFHSSNTSFYFRGNHSVTAEPHGRFDRHSRNNRSESKRVPTVHLCGQTFGGEPVDGFYQLHQRCENRDAL